MKIEMNQELTGRVVKIVLDEERESFGTEMLQHNSVKGLIGACVHNVDQSSLYLYEVGDFGLLSDFYKKRVCTLADCKEIFTQIVEILQRTTDYFLSEKDVVLRLDAMFYDERERQLYALYLDGYEGDVAKGIAGVLEDFMDSMNHKDRELVFFVYGLHRIVKDSNFSINRLIEYIDQYEAKKSIPIAPDEKKQVVPAISKKVTKKAVNEEKQKRETNQYLKAVGIIAIGIVFLWIAKESETLLHPITKEPNWIKTILFFGTLVMAEGMALYRECKDIFWKPKETVKLISTDKHKEEICIVSSPCYIGSNPERATVVVDGKDISPVHIKIVVEEKRVYVIDQESDYGTWKNEKRLVPWERNELKEGDSIRISSMEYKVKFPSHTSCAQ